MPLGRSFFSLLLLVALAVASRATAQEAGRGRTPDSFSPLERIRTEDLKRRVSLLAAEGKRLEAASVAEQLAELATRQTSNPTGEWMRAAWLYYDAGAFPEMLRVVQAYRKVTSSVSSSAGEKELRVAEVLLGSSRLDWNVYRSRIRETPPTSAAQPVDIVSAEGQVALASLLWRELSQPERARRVLEKLIRTHPNQPEARLLLVDLYRMLGRESDANRERAEYVRLDPESPRAAVFRVWRLKALGKKEEAIRALQAVREKYPSSTSLLQEIADIYDTLDRPELVAATWQEALLQDVKRGGESYFPRLQLVVNHFVARRQWAHLRGLLERLLVDRPRDPFLALTLAQVFAMEERPEKVIPLARAAQPGGFDRELRTLGVYAALATGDLQAARELIPPNSGELQTVARWLDPQSRPTLNDAFEGQDTRFSSVPFGFFPRPSGIRRPVFLPSDSRWTLEELAVERMTEVAPLQVECALRLASQGQLERAAAIMEQVARKHPDSWPPLLFLYHYHQAGRRPEQAQQVRTRLDSVKPANLRVQDPFPSTFVGRPFRVLGEEQFAQPERALRAAQALMLEGKLEEARTALLPLRESRLARDVHRTLGAVYLALEKPDEAQREWSSAGLFPPFRPQPFPFAAPFSLPNFVPDPPTPRGDGTRLSHYPPAYVASFAASLFLRETNPPALGERLWEFLLRQALVFDKDYVPALSGLGHALRTFPGVGSPALAPAVKEARMKESQLLLERVIEKDPANLSAYWALERFEEAARKNPDHVMAWRRLTNRGGSETELLLEARRNVRRLAPDDVENRRYLVIHLAMQGHPEEALREARSLAEFRLPLSDAEYRRRYPGQDLSVPRADPTRFGRTLAGALLWQRGEWAASRTEWAQVLAKGEGWRAELDGTSLSTLSALAALALGDPAAAQRELSQAIRVNSIDPLPRLLLAWLAKRAGKAAEAEFQLAAADNSDEIDAPSEFGLRLSYEPVLKAVVARYPDCFPAAYLLALDQMRRGGEDFAGQTAVTSARGKLEALAEQYPHWSGPLDALQRSAWASEAYRGEALLRHRRALTVFLGPKAPVPAGSRAPTAPGPFLRAARSGALDLSSGRVSAVVGDLLIVVGHWCQVFENRTGASVHSFPLPRDDAPPALAGRTVIQPVRGGAAAFDALTGDLLWTVDWAPTVREAPRVQGDTVLLVAEDGALLAVEAATGKTRWQSPRPPVPVLNLALEGDRLFAVDQDGRTRAVDLKTGKELWSAPFPGAAQGGALRVEKGQALAFGGRLFLGAGLPEENTRSTAAFDTQTGKLLWTQGHSGGGLPALWVQVGDRLAYVNTHYEEFELLDPATGKILKTQRRDEQTSGNSTWVGAVDNRLIWVDARGEWHARIPETGAVAWKKVRPSPDSWKITLAPSAWLFTTGTRFEWHAR